MVELAQGDAAPHAGAQAVVQGAGGVEPNHGRAVDGEGDDVPAVQPKGDGADQQQHGPQHRQRGADAVGNGGPGAQAVIGIAALFLGAAAGPGRGDPGRGKFGIGHKFIHKKPPCAAARFQKRGALRRMLRTGEPCTVKGGARTGTGSLTAFLRYSITRLLRNINRKIT